MRTLTLLVLAVLLLCSCNQKVDSPSDFNHAGQSLVQCLQPYHVVGEYDPDVNITVALISAAKPATVNTNQDEVIALTDQLLKCFAGPKLVKKDGIFEVPLPERAAQHLHLLVLPLDHFTAVISVHDGQESVAMDYMRKLRKSHIAKSSREDGSNAK